MNEYRDTGKLVLAFAIGVSLSAGYVALGQLHGHEQDVVVIEERCADAEGPHTAEASALAHGIELAPLAGNILVPEGVRLWLGLDGLWLREGEDPLLRLEAGQLASGDVELGQLPGLAEALRELHAERTAVLWADHRLPGATLTAVLATLHRAGIGDYAFVVAGVDDSPRAYRFGAEAMAAPPGGRDPGLELSLRLSDAGGVAAWIRPTVDGLARIGGPRAQPLDLGEAAASPDAPCLLADAELPDAPSLAALGAELCALGRGDERGRLGVEYGVAAKRRVGDLLGLRARFGDSDSCRVHSTIAAPALSEPRDCDAALAASEMMSYLDEQGPAPDYRSEVRGLLDKDTIRAVVRANIADIRDCYNLGLRDDPELGGRVVVDFVIGEDGEVVGAEVGAETKIDHDAVPGCMAEAISSWSFPAPAKGKVKVSYPFNLEPG